MTQIQLRMDESALRQSLRFAFANHDTVVQELLQNARRAGATKIVVTYSADTKELFVSDDGGGIEDFSKLMTIGTSGWDQQIAQAEKPYGMGFLSAIYAAKHVSIVSRGQCLAFDTESALNNGSFEVTRDVSGSTSTTTVALIGFEWKNAQTAIEKMAVGYSVPITFNDLGLSRPHALTNAFVQTSVGHIRIGLDDCDFGDMYVYLQGFLVHKPTGWHSRSSAHDIVHLDSAKFFGKFPDRDRVIDEAAMLSQVKVVIRELYVEKLERMRETMPPAEFCAQAYRLAQRLNRLDIFNDIELVPTEWLAEIHTMPHDYWDSTDVIGNLEDQTPITREDVSSGRKVVAVITDDFVAGDDNAVHRRWLWAYAKKALVLDKTLDDKHWLYQEAQIHDDTDVSIEVVNPGKTGGIDYSRTEYIGGYRIQLCDAGALTCGDERIVINEPFADTADGAIVVPMDGAQPMYVASSVLKQLESFRDDDIWLQDECDKDEAVVNDVAREIAADTPQARAGLVLTAALREFRELQGKAYEIEIDENGIVSVKSMCDLPKTES